MLVPSSWPAPIPVIVLTGFLGAGKTTLLNALLADPRFADTAVIVNEFGDVAVDHDLVRVGSREMMVTTTGCLCCTPGSDVRTSLFELMEARRARKIPQFSRVIVETTGLADPAPVINQLVRGGMVATSIQHLRVANQFALMGVVCAVDAVFGTLSLDRHFECMKQIAMADRIVITKSDLTRQAGSHDVDELRAILRQINGTAQLIDRHGDHFDLSQVFAPRPSGPETLGEDVVQIADRHMLDLRPHVVAFVAERRRRLTLVDLVVAIVGIAAPEPQPLDAVYQVIPFTAYIDVAAQHVTGIVL